MTISKPFTTDGTRWIVIYNSKLNYFDTETEARQFFTAIVLGSVSKVSRA